MQLHEAVRLARLERKLSQKKLAQEAGIQRRQLATLEKGGNVTLATVRKVLAKLPNLESFTLDAVNVDVNAEPRPDDRFGETMSLLAQALEEISKRLQGGHYPTPDDVAALHEVNARLLNDLPPTFRTAALGDTEDTYREELGAEAVLEAQRGRGVEGGREGDAGGGGLEEGEEEDEVREENEDDGDEEEQAVS